ncbi:GDSL esterase/lipase At1g29670-like isoform X2 [Salvia miltiorrhiza]|uniref:GDSL esterase/lipase At1g29670-like isoform X2 n=1 Tax=Salvia miltiorrhiza TaxID=226208 RepID=UPI0025ABA929|nr:GDSL esterase/lipase At1g29670-like isoform X2 [Salvia miltiorrhiza]
MAAKLFIFYMLYFCIPSVYGMKQAPCVFFFGDSLFDNGNNNFLLTFANVNYPPYGIDYPAGPTGRFSNGKNLPDFLAEFLGFDNPIPPFATATGANILNGVNYASGGAGILDQSGAALGNVMSLNKQLINHGNTAFKMGLLLGNATRATDHLNKCLYLSNMGNNDYLSNYLMPKFYASSTLFTPQQFAEILINQYRRQLEILYKYGARKVVVFGLGSIAYIPQFRSTNESVDSINRITQQFYNKLAPLVHDLNTDLHAAQFIFINVTNFQLGDPSTTDQQVQV